MPRAGGRTARHVSHALPQRILGHLRGRRAEMARFLETLLAAESPSAAPESQAPVLALLTNALEAAGYRVRRVAGRASGGHLYARPRGRSRGAPYQLILGHCDTVWPLGTVATMPIRTEGDLLRGPGAFDMKGGLVQMVFALRALGELGLVPSVTPIVFVSSDEERGSPESARHIRRLARGADRALVVEPALGPEGRLKTARKGVGWFRVRVVGRSAHSGLEPEAGASAILELSHVIQALDALADPVRGITVNVGQVEGGLAPNVVAPEARAVVDVRVGTAEDGRWVEEAIAALRARTPGTRLEVEGGMHRQPMERTPRNRLLWEAARRAGEAMGLALEESAVGGASDGNLASPWTATLDGLGPVGDGAHAEHEYVRLDSLVERGALLVLLLLIPPLPAPGEGGGSN